jgi:hypothetical protein
MKGAGFRKRVKASKLSEKEIALKGVLDDETK